MMKRFKEKTVIVTDAGSGIGRATAIRFANEGANVVLVGHTSQALEETAKDFPQDRTWIHTDNYLKVICDISVKTQVEEMIKRVLEKFATIDILVNNTDETHQATTTELSAEDWESSIDVYLNSMFNVCQAAIPHLITTKGNIINVSSLSSLSAIGGDGNIDASNAATTAISKLTQTLALDYAADGVRVNAVNPSVSEDNMSNTIEDSDVKTNKLLNHCPLGRIATPQDIAAAITFLASDDAAMITGVNLPVDGGASASNH